MIVQRLKNEKGFTLVEVIVVAVIVAVLALVSIQLYQGYVTEARKNTAENLAASAASYLQSLVNIHDTGFVSTLTNPLEAGNSWVAFAGDSSLTTNKVIFTCPANAKITYTEGDSGTVKAEVGGTPSKGNYRYR